MNKFLEDWLDEFDEFELDLSQDESSLSTYFDEQTTKLSKIAEQLKNKLDSLELDEKGKNLKGKVEHLQVQLALGKAESRDAFEEQKGKIEHAVHDVRTSLDEWEDSLEGKAENWGKDVKSFAEKIQARLETMRLQYHLGAADMGDGIEEKRKELKAKVHELREKAKEKADSADDHWEEFTDEVSEAYDHMKKAVRGLFA
jgi:ElaB/YqjD/DUF883 family membrane-anchored ribosome-binding protein